MLGKKPTTTAHKREPNKSTFEMMLELPSRTDLSFPGEALTEVLTEKTMPCPTAEAAVTAISQVFEFIVLHFKNIIQITGNKKDAH